MIWSTLYFLSIWHRLIDAAVKWFASRFFWDHRWNRLSQTSVQDVYLVSKFVYDKFVTSIKAICIEIFTHDYWYLLLWLKLYALFGITSINLIYYLEWSSHFLHLAWSGVKFGVNTDFFNEKIVVITETCINMPLNFYCKKFNNYFAKESKRIVNKIASPTRIPP